MSSKLQALLKEKISENIKAHSSSEKNFTEFDIYKTGQLQQIDLKLIKPNTAQPRLNFDEHELKSLAESIKEIGLLQPIIVRKQDHYYEIVAGERRYRAFQLLKKTEIDAIVIAIDEEKNVLMALAENLSRADLSDYEIANTILKFKNYFSSKTQYAQALGISRQKLYKLFSFEALPSIILDRLQVTPVLISADTAEQLASFKKQHGFSDDVFAKSLLAGLELIANHKLKQTALVGYLQKQLIQCPDSDNFQSSVTAVKKTYQKQGKTIGKIKKNSKKLFIEIDNFELTSEKEQKIEAFFDQLLG